MLVLSVTLVLDAGAALAAGDASSASASPISPAKQQAEIAGAKMAVRRVDAVKKLQDIGPCFTNRTAGEFALMMRSMAGDSAMPGDDFTKRFNAILARYGISDSSSHKSREATLKLHGRSLFADVARLVTSLQSERGDSRLTGTPPSPSDRNYRVVSKTQVNMTDRADPTKAMCACLEDGVWRIDIGDMG